MDYEIKEGGQTIFNQAMYQMLRLHEIHREINLCWTNLSASTLGVPNYQILFDNLTAYYLEVLPTFTEKEKTKVNLLLDKVEKLVYDESIWVVMVNRSMAGRTNTKRLDITKFNKIKSGLREFQALVLDVAHGHGLGNPTKDDPSKAVLN